MEGVGHGREVLVFVLHEQLLPLPPRCAEEVLEEDGYEHLQEHKDDEEDEGVYVSHVADVNGPVGVEGRQNVVRPLAKGDDAK